jgi:hypothetical protein
MVWLCSAETGTKKCRDAEAKGVAIVDEEWVRNRIPGGVGSSAGNKATGRTALQKRKQAGSDDGSDEEDGDSDVDDDGNDDDNAATGVHPNVGGAYRQEHKEGTNGGPTLIGSVMSWIWARLVGSSSTTAVNTSGNKEHDDFSEESVEGEEDESDHEDTRADVDGHLLPRQSFVPLFDFVDELIDNDPEEGTLDADNPNRFVLRIMEPFLSKVVYFCWFVVQTCWASDIL